MADTKALRRRIEDQIRSLQEKLRAIDLVEEMSREIGVDGEKSEEATLVGVSASFAGQSVAEACKLLVTDSNKTWTGASVLEEIKGRGLPGATRQAVAVALRRLEKSGLVASRRLSRRRVGYTSKALRINVHN